MITPEFILANRLEAGLWFAIALGCAITACRRPTGTIRRDAIVAAAAFVLFGLSDIVETRTGAWWRPWWLFAWKAFCVVALAWLFWRYRQGRKRATPARTDAAPPL